MEPSETPTEQMARLGARARAAGRALAKAPGRLRTAALGRMAEFIDAARDQIKAANGFDLAAADEKGIKGAMRDRLALTDARIDGMIRGLREVAALPDPIGEVTGGRVRPNGLNVTQVRIPLGVVGIIYEARPNVTADAAGLCIKSGNAVFLRGGSEAAHSNAAILEVLRRALVEVGLPADALMTLPSTDRTWIMEMLGAEDSIDVIIPRGGEALIRFVAEHARMPVIKHYKGVCHVYVDAEADIEQAVAIAHNAKVQRPGVCNAMETLLIHRAIAERALPAIASKLIESGVELRGCAMTRALVPEALAAEEADYYAEYLDLVLAVRVVDDLDAAIAHIEQYGSDHTEAIVSRDYTAVQRFLDEVSSAVVVANASTRFADGGELGLGAEIGISTTKLHAYGPMGVVDLTTRKFVVRGAGQIRT